MACSPLECGSDSLVQLERKAVNGPAAIQVAVCEDRRVLRQVDVNAGATRCTGRIVDVVKAGLGLP